MRLRITWENLGHSHSHHCAQLPAFLLATRNLSTLISPGKCDSLGAELSTDFYSLIEGGGDIETQYRDAKMGHLFDSKPCPL